MPNRCSSGGSCIASRRAMPGSGWFVPVVVEATPEGEAGASTTCRSSGDVVAGTGRMEIELTAGRRMAASACIHFTAPAPQLPDRRALALRQTHDPRMHQQSDTE